ncbi:MAG: hypothetical protein ACRDTR_00520 [Rubrobacter sp.]
MGQRPPVVLFRGQGKDGNPNHPYVHNHPTNYIWRWDIERLTARLVNMDPFYRRIWVNTYFRHPPVSPRDRTSFDVWGFGGRGDPLDVELGWQVRKLLFNDPHLPYIDWIIWQGRWWKDGFGPGPSPPGPPGSDPKHLTHLHVTYL